jgi:hypothetical protein
MAGVDLRTVQELLGHKTLAMTLRHAHLSAHQLDAVQRLNRAVSVDGSSTRRSARARAASASGVELLDLLDENGSGGALARTGDLGIMSPSQARLLGERSMAGVAVIPRTYGR